MCTWNILESRVATRLGLHGHQYPDEPFAALADLKDIIEKARKQTYQGIIAQHTRLPGILAVGCLNRIASLQQQTFGHTDALLCGLGTCWKMLRPMLLRVH